jgi:hypothetical protein
VTGTRLLVFARQNAIALVALFVALGGTGYAAVMINGKEIEKGTIRGSALKNHTLTRKQINESKLGKVPSAKTADFATAAGSANTSAFATLAGSASSATTASTASNANALGGVPAAGFLQSGCGAGKVNGYAQINGGPSLPNTYTSSASFLADTFNCSGQAVEVRRESAGAYMIKFPGNPGAIGFGNWAACAPNGLIACIVVDDRDVAVTQIVGGPDNGSFQVLVQDTTNSAHVDGRVDVLIP